MAPSLIHLPNGQTLTVSPVFSGFYFRANELNTHNHDAFPPGWTVILQEEDKGSQEDDENGAETPHDSSSQDIPQKHGHVHRYRKPTLKNDALFLSSISNPSSNEFKPPSSPSRQIAMMLWATLYWYFHQPPPDPHLNTSTTSNLPPTARPKSDWRIRIKREGIFKGRHLLSKLERMGLITSEDSSVGPEIDDRTGEGWQEMFVSQRAFWQIDARIFLFTLTPTLNSPFPSASPYPSRPNSPIRDPATTSTTGTVSPRPDPTHDHSISGLWSPPPAPANPFTSASHLPTYYPPPPTQFTMTNQTLHPLRQKPPRQGETFYTRYIPRFGQYLSFRVASLSAKPPPHHGPTSALPPHNNNNALAPLPSDLALLHTWMNNPRVSGTWGVAGPPATQEAFLRKALSSRHSFPAIGCWDGKPFGYFEIYWVKEDGVGKYLRSQEVGDWDRGFHVLVGEEEVRGRERVRVWLSALVHWCWVVEGRTGRVVCEPRVDGVRFIEYLLEAGFYKEREIAFPFKQAALMMIKREAWEAPVL